MVDVPTRSDGVVTLRAHTEDDVEALLEQCTDPVTIEGTTVPVPYSLDDAKRFVREITPGSWESGHEWGFAVEADGRYAGTVVLRPMEDRRAEVAYASHPWARGRGLMERALRLLLDWGFDDQGLATVIWWAHVGNWGSRKLAESVGFSIDGTVRQWLPQRGELRDAWVGSLRADEPRTFRTPWLTTPVLAGGGLVLRELTEVDVPRIVEACSDDRTQHWLGRLPDPYTDDAARAFLETLREKRATNGGVTWAITEPEASGDLLLGNISVFDHTPEVEVEIGYWAHPSARGQGVLTRAVPLVTAYAFETLGVNRIKIMAAVGNVASRHVIEANGFRQTGVERLGTQVKDGYADLALYDLLREEWRERR